MKNPFLLPLAVVAVVVVPLWVIMATTNVSITLAMISAGMSIFGGVVVAHERFGAMYPSKQWSRAGYTFLALGLVGMALAAWLYLRS